MKFRVCIIGTSQSGKSTVGQVLNEMCGGGYFDTVDMLKEGLAKQLWDGGEVPGFPEIHKGDPPDEEAMAWAMAEVMRYKTDRPDYRRRLLEYGETQEADDPCFTVTEPLRRACFVAGTRTEPQMVEMRKRVDWILYTQRDGCPPNSTDRLGPEFADFIIDNNGTFVDLRNQLEAFLTLAGPGTPNLAHRRSARERIDVELEQQTENVCPPQD